MPDFSEEGSASPVSNPEIICPILALFASSRRHGNTGQLMDRVASELGIEVVDLATKDISAFDYEHRNRQDEFESLIDHVLKFRRIIFASPVYWYSVSPPMKVFLDRISDLLELPDLLAKGRRLRGKEVYVLCTSIEEQASPSFVDAWRETCDYLGMHYSGLLHANCRDGYRAALYEDDVNSFVRKLRMGAIPSKEMNERA
jgi:multimeric flavodoxin WrbA